MNKLKFCFCGLLSFTAFAFAQNEEAVSSLQEHPEARPFSVGLHVSAGYNAYWSDDNAKDFWGPTVNGGVTFLLPLMGVISLNPELSLDFRTASQETTEPFGTQEYTVKETLTELGLDLPILVRFHFNDALFAELGPQVSMNISDEYTVDDNGDEYSTKNTERSAFELATIMGVGYRIVPKFELDFRVVIGLNKVYDDDVITGTSPRTFQILVGATYWVM